MNPYNRLMTSRGLAAVLALGLVAAAHGATLPAGITLHAKQELVRNSGSEPESLDPAVAESVGANNIMRDLFEGLTSTDNSGKVVPGVAETWKQTDPVTWVFKLRKDAMWSNGEQVTAEDFVYGWRRFMDPKTASTLATTYGMFIQNGMLVAKGEKPPAEVGIKAVDRFTVEVKTATPVPFLADLMSKDRKSVV